MAQETAQQSATSGNAQTDLKNLLEAGFGGDMFMFALALGREEDQLKSMLDGSEDVDEDLEMKVRGIAQERNIPLA
jgi:hypothetical protein